MTVFCCVTELLCRFEEPDKDFRNLILISGTIRDITVYLSVYSWISFIIKTEKPFYEKDKRGDLFWGMPFMGLTALSLCSPFTRMFFYIDGSGMLHDGKLVLFQMDINHFKDINDHYGHVEGDKMIIHVADSIKAVLDMIPRKAFLARYGGDEFILIINMDSEGDIKNLIKGIKRKVGNFGPGLKKIPA